jgi:hypothetical protein
VSDTLEKVTLEPVRIVDQRQTTVTVTYSTDEGGTLLILPDDEEHFEVSPPTHKLLAGRTRDSFQLTITAKPPLVDESETCYLTFKFVLSILPGEVNVDPQEKKS